MSQHIFPFFKLPAELRDMVYDYSLQHVKLTSFMSLARRVTCVAPPNLMAVSQQFNMELIERVRKSSHLYVAEICTVGWPNRANIVTQQANIRSFTVISEVNDHENSLKIQRAWIEQAIEYMPNLKALHICLGIYSAASRYDYIEWRTKLEQADLTSLPHLTTLEIYERGSCPPAARGGKLPWRCLIMEWNKTTGRIEDTDQVRRKLLSILTDFWYDDRFVQFQDLDNTGYDDYHEVIEQSMDFDMLRYMMRDGFYCQVEEFIDTVLQIVRNVKKFEPLAKVYSKEADKLEAELWRKIHQVPQWVHLSPGDFEITAENGEIGV